MKEPVEVEYIESGTFCGGEECVYEAGIEHGEACVVLKKEEYRRLVGFKNSFEKWEAWYKKNLLDENNKIKKEFEKLLPV